MTTQFELNLNDNENKFDSALQCGNFTTTIEYVAPNVDQPFNLAIANGLAIVKQINNHENILGAAISFSEHSHSPIETCTVLRQALSKEHTLNVILSGSGMNKEKLLTTLGKIESVGINNVTFVTGDLSFIKGEVTANPNGYLDSVQMLIDSSNKEKMHFSATTNPFKYTSTDMYLQYYKMIRKLFQGAKHIVTQSGLDMAKLQELQWYLQQREIQIPFIARLELISLDKAETIHANEFNTGVEISKYCSAMIQREKQNLSSEKFYEQQLKRLELQIAGCRLLGYSGVQITGIKETKNIDDISRIIENANNNYPKYDLWLEEWNKFNGDVNFAPFVSAYYGYEGLLSPTRATYDNDVQTSKCSRRNIIDKSLVLKYKLFRSLYKPKRPKILRELTKRLLLKDSKLDFYKLNIIFFCDIDKCPKKLIYGACGGCKIDGTCENGLKPCFFHHVFAVASHFNQLNKLEERVSNNV